MSEFAAEELADRIRSGSRPDLARGITLVESGLRTDREDADRLLAQLDSDTLAPTIRVAISGIPGGGKSTLVDGLGAQLIEAGHRVAVLAVDPSSTQSGGSVLADRVRMQRIAVDPSAFVRPSPTRGALGGVTRATGDTMQLVEAAGYDVVLVETVGVGQSETDVVNLVDVYVVVLLAGAGDDLQHIKRGAIELADVLVINKADGAGSDAAVRAAGELASALRLGGSGEREVVVTSALEDRGIDDLWSAIQRVADDRDRFRSRRRDQRVRRMHELVADQLASRWREEAGQLAGELEESVAVGAISPAAAAAELIEVLLTNRWNTKGSQ